MCAGQLMIEEGEKAPRRVEWFKSTLDKFIPLFYLRKIHTELVEV